MHLVCGKEQKTEGEVSDFDYSKMAPEILIKFLIIVFKLYLVVFGKFDEDPLASFRV